AEREGRGREARMLLARAATENPNDAQALLANAALLDRYGDPEARAAYAKVLAASPSQDQKRAAARRLLALSLESGDVAQARAAADSFREAGGKDLPDAATALNATPRADDSGYGYTEVPGLYESFLRMAALSTDLDPHEILPALGRNLVTGGYRTSRGGEAAQETEYLKLLKQYLTQARELTVFAGGDQALDVPDCESAETAEVLKILGYRLRGECGPEAVLETVNPSRAFLSIDSAFPLAELEDAYRRETAFHLDYKGTQLPVLFGPEYWVGAAKSKDPGSFIEAFLGDPLLARLYVAMSKLHRPTALALKEQIPAERLKNYANVLDFFGASFEIRNGQATYPGPEEFWRKLVGVAPAKGAEFYQGLIEGDDGWMAAYFDSLQRVNGPARAYFTNPQRMERFYDALRGRITSPGPARPIFRATGDLLLLTSRMDFKPDGSAVIPGGVGPWQDIFVKHPHGKYDGKLTKSAQNWQTADDVIEAMFAMCRKVIENEPLKMFLAITDLERDRSTPLAEATVRRLQLAYPEFGGQLALLNEAVLSDATISAYFDTLEKLSKIGRSTRRANAVGAQQALVSLWAILVRQGQIQPAQADAALARTIALFNAIEDEKTIFRAGRDGLTGLLTSAGASADASPQDAILALLAGRPAPGEEAAHREIVRRMNTLFNQQRLVSVKTLFDLADHLERVSRGESYNAQMANRLAATISEVTLPTSELSTPEANALIRGDWVDDHIRDQRTLNLRRSVDRAQGNPAATIDILGEIAPLLRDSLVGLVYIYYSPPGAELIRANPLFVRSHDFLGPEGSRSWSAPRLQGSGWPTSAGGRLTGSLVGLAYALNDAEQNFLIPTERQALIWQDLAPQVLLNATVGRWWGVDPNAMHFVGLHMRLGRALLTEAALDPTLRGEVLDVLSTRVEPARRWAVEQGFKTGRFEEAVAEIAPAELYELAMRMRQDKPERIRELGSPFAEALDQMPESINYERVAMLFGSPHPELSHSYRLDLLHLPLFPTVMGYSSRVLAESWESTNLYWAALADAAHLEPAMLNLRAPEWTQRAVERIFATHLEDWPALLHSMRIIGEEYRARMQAQLAAETRAAAN
ncbi:MAG: hypothetical protein H6509_05065, partial [Bryobacterales bacterium]|nr:hypothetical protein [Bryobacterales bacterium]